MDRVVFVLHKIGAWFVCQSVMCHVRSVVDGFNRVAGIVIGSSDYEKKTK